MTRGEVVSFLKSSVVFAALPEKELQALATVVVKIPQELAQGDID